MRRILLILIAIGFIGIVLAKASAQDDKSLKKTLAAEPKTATYNIHHSLTVKDLPSGAKKVRIWFWFPDDDPVRRC